VNLAREIMFQLAKHYHDLLLECEYAFHLMKRYSHKWKFLIDNISKPMLEAWLRGVFFAGFVGGLAYPSRRKIDRPKRRACHGAHKRDLV
jgi:hypothetical protein